MTTFYFEYHCDECDKPFCERILIMNLALDREDETLCLECLSKAEGQDCNEAFYKWIHDYIQSRDCFLSPWQKFNAKECPRITDKSCFCKAD